MEKITKKDQDWVMDWLVIFRDKLLLQNKTLEVNWFDVPHEDDSGITATCNVNNSYLKISINIYPEFWEQEKEEQKEILLHEMFHVIIDPVYFPATEGISPKERIWLENLRETTVQHLTNIYIKYGDY